jgi:hypothetical protein
VETMKKRLKGIVTEVKGNKACILTTDGEFAYVRINGSIPSIGEEYEGSRVGQLSFLRRVSAAASIAVCIIAGSAAYVYATPVSTISLSSPQVKVEVNRWNRIIKYSAPNSSMEKYVDSLKIKNKPLSDGLEKIIDNIKNVPDNVKNKDSKPVYSNKENLPDKKKDSSSNNKTDKNVVLYVDDKQKNVHSEITKFEKHVQQKGMKVEIKNIKRNNDKPKKNNENKNENKDKKQKNN